MDYLHRAKLFRTKKRLGQNFLINADAIQAILNNANISKNDTVIEIGAGIGFVTEQLVKHAHRVIAVELDEDATKKLKKIQCDNLEIIHQDILKTNLSDLCAEKVKIVANIPYYITSPIIAHLLGEISDLNNKNRQQISEIILMVQYEVAQRIVANEKSTSKQYGLLSILSQFWADCEIIRRVGRKSFYPAPKVDSAIVKLTVRQEPKLKLSDYGHFRKTVKAAFSQRRKNIKNCLISAEFKKEIIIKSLENIGIGENTRGETVSIEKFGELSEELIKNEGKCIKNSESPHFLQVKCPAKINLTLEVLNKRKDGFHNIQSVMQTINLFDILTIKAEKSEKFEIKLSGTSDEIPYDERNLVYKAVELFIETLHPSPLVGEGGCKPDEGFKKLISQRANSLRNQLTTPEEILWYYLRNRRFEGLKFRRQVPIKKYIADFVCFEKKLIIELDGSGHLKDEQMIHDKKREDFLKSQNYKILRFYNNDIFNNLQSVLEKIYQEIFNTPHPQPLSHKGRGENLNNFTSRYKISIHIEKNIPIAAGLAGGSTDAAGTLWGLNKIFGNVLSNKELHKLCAKLGSDLNFCLEGGCQLTTGRGEILEKLPFQEFRLSLIKPKHLGISAKEAYTKFSQLENKPEPDMTSKLVEALKSSNTNIEKFLHNDLEVAIIKDYKELQKIKDIYPAAIMSGSGSTFFVLNENIEKINDNFWIKEGLKSISYGISENI